MTEENNSNQKEPAQSKESQTENTAKDGDQTKKDSQDQAQATPSNEVAVKTGKGKKKKKKIIRQVAHGRAYIQATYNNTIVTLTDLNGNVLASSSAGQNGFKGRKKPHHMLPA